jgi:hypothetical protein
MRVLLLLGLLPGCIWSKHLHDYSVDIDDPSSVEVSILTADGLHPVLAAGADGSGTLEVDGTPITVTRDANGIRVEAPKALGPMQIVDAYGKPPGSFSREQAFVSPGAPLLIDRHFVLGRMVGVTYEEESYVMVHAQTDWSHVERVTARQHPNRAIGWAMWTAEFGLLYASGKLAADGKKGAALALWVPMGVLGWWGLGQIVGPRRDYQLYPEVTP